MTNKRVAFFFLLPVLLSFILHLHVFKRDVMGFHVWRQAQTQTVIYNFVFTDNTILHPQKFDVTNGSTALLYEFPLYQWIIAQADRAFGYSVLYTRAATFLFFIALLLGFYRLLKNFVSTEIALVANALLCFSPMLYYYGVTPLPDTLALCFATWSLHFFFKSLNQNQITGFFFFCFFLMLSALVKLPYILFGGAFAWQAMKQMRSRKYSGLTKRALIFLVLMVPVAVWYMHAIPTWGTNPVTKGMLGNDKQLLHLLDCLQFNILSTVPEVITNYASCLFLCTGLYLFFKQKKHLGDAISCLVAVFVLFSAYFLFELNAIEKVHDYYLMPFVPLVFLVVACGAKFFYTSKRRWIVWAIVCLVPITAWLRMGHRWNEEGLGFPADLLTYRTQLSGSLPKEAHCIVDNDDSQFIALYYLKRKGYSLKEGELSPEMLRSLYTRGATHLITTHTHFRPEEYTDFAFKELFSKEIKLYKLSLK